MAKLSLVLENVRDRHMINILEEGTTELVALKTKRFLNENLAIINKILVEEGVVDGAKAHLQNNWGKYAGGAAAGGLGYMAANSDAAQAIGTEAFGADPLKAVQDAHNHPEAFSGLTGKHYNQEQVTDRLATMGNNVAPKIDTATTGMIPNTTASGADNTGVLADAQANVDARKVSDAQDAVTASNAAALDQSRTPGFQQPDAATVQSNQAAYMASLPKR